MDAKQQAPAFQPTQSQQEQAPDDQAWPDREDCPEKDGQGGSSGSDDGSGAGASGTAL